MFKLTNTLCFCMLVSVFAPASLAQTGDALFMQDYSFESVSSAIQSISMCDDFMPVAPGNLGVIEIWMNFYSGMPPSLTVAILEDDGTVNPGNADVLYSGSLPADFVDTGDVLYGYAIYKVTCSLDDTVPVSGSQRYWIQIDPPVGGYCIIQTPVVFGSTIWLFYEGEWQTSTDVFGFPFDFFFNLYQPVSLQRNSWGSIKTSF